MNNNNKKNLSCSECCVSTSFCIWIKLTNSIPDIKSWQYTWKVCKIKNQRSSWNEVSLSWNITLFFPGQLEKEKGKIPKRWRQGQSDCKKVDLISSSDVKLFYSLKRKKKDEVSLINWIFPFNLFWGDIT